MDATNDVETPRTNEPMRDKTNFEVLAHQGGTYSGLHVTLLHFGCGHLMTAPASICVTRMSFLHFGHGMSYSIARRTSSFGPSTIDGGSAMMFSGSANVVQTQ